MRQLNYELREMTRRFREGSFATQANRRNMLQLFADQLYEAGYKKMHAHDFKGRHINKLLERWKADGLSHSTIKNRMSVLRWWAGKVNNPGVLARENSHYGIERRTYVARESKARDLPEDKLAKIRHPYVRMSLELQRAFGLRREESIKIRPHQADHGDRLVLKDTWCKGGRPREVPIRTQEQRDVLERAKALVKLKSAALIPADKRYVEHLHTYEMSVVRAGLRKMHGLRHAYAQARFEELTGFPCPVMGGPSQAEMTDQQVQADYDARLLISEELGHARISITNAYLGSAMLGTPETFATLTE